MAKRQAPEGTYSINGKVLDHPKARISALAFRAAKTPTSELVAALEAAGIDPFAGTAWSYTLPSGKVIGYSPPGKTKRAQKVAAPAS